MSGALRRLRRRPSRAGPSAGQSLVETALILPVFLLLVLGLLDVGLVVYIQHTVAEAAREAARFAVARPEDDLPTIDEIRQKAIAAAPGVPITASDITATYPAPDDDGQRVEITISVNVDLLTPLIGNLLGGSHVVTVRAVMYQL